jgi:hypothetical protein
VTVLAKHPTWSECPRCGRLFTSDRAFAAHMTTGTSRSCRDPARVRQGDQRLVEVSQGGMVWRWQTGDTRRPPEHPRQGALDGPGGPQRPGGVVRALPADKRRTRPPTGSLLL